MKSKVFVGALLAAAILTAGVAEAQAPSINTGQLKKNAVRVFNVTASATTIVSLETFFAQGNIETVINTVNRLNRADASGRRRVRIHAVGFPVLFNVSDGWTNVVRFSALMRKMLQTISAMLSRTEPPANMKA